MALIQDYDSQLTSGATGQPMEYWMVTTTDDKGNKALGGGMMEKTNARATNN